MIKITLEDVLPTFENLKYYEIIIGSHGSGELNYVPSTNIYLKDWIEKYKDFEVEAINYEYHEFYNDMIIPRIYLKDYKKALDVKEYYEINNLLTEEV